MSLHIHNMHEFADVMLLLGYFSLCQGYSRGLELAYMTPFPLKPLVTFTEYFLSLGLILVEPGHATYCATAPIKEFHITAKFTGFCTIEGLSGLRNTSAWQKSSQIYWNRRPWPRPSLGIIV